MHNICYVGIDTSNYTTSVAVADAAGRVIANLKAPLSVKAGERGLRQSDAVFAHVKNLPQLTGKSLELLQYLGGFVDVPENSLLLFNLIKGYIGNNFSKDFELKMLADEFKISVRTINRLFQKNAGTTPLHYRQQCRFTAACELLRQNDLSIKEIADKLGFCNQFHFSREFTRLAGISPRNWRRQETGGMDN